MIVRSKKARAQSPTESSPADATRTALVQAALQLFGTKGFDGTSTREIAALARSNIGSIAYHFGGKEGLRIAAADHIVETIQGVAGKALGDRAVPQGADEARAQLMLALERMVAFIVASPQAGEIVQFVLRELTQPTAALDRIYDGVFAPTHKRLCQLWEAATGEPAESDDAKLAVFTMIGQVIYFRIGREAVLRRMGWNGIGQAEAAAITLAAGRTLTALLAARSGDER